MKLLCGFDVSDPWSKEVGDSLNSPDAAELCLECLEPQERGHWICHNCGWPTGPYNNVMDYMYVFSIGALYRSGVDGSVELNKFRVFGLVLFSFASYGPFAPIYWYRLLNATKGKFIPGRDCRISTGKKSEQDDFPNSQCSLEI